MKRIVAIIITAFIIMYFVGKDNCLVKAEDESNDIVLSHGLCYNGNFGDSGFASAAGLPFSFSSLDSNGIKDYAYKGATSATFFMNKIEYETGGGFLLKFSMNNLSVTLENPVTLAGNSDSWGGLFVSDGCTATINNQTLNIIGTREAFEAIKDDSGDGTLVFNNINVNVDASGNTTCPAVSLNNLTLGENVVVKISSGGTALKLTGTLLNDNNYYIIGSTDGNTTNLKIATKDPSDNIYKINGVPAKYIQISTTPPTPEPVDPSPSEPVVKDESCEKVIGPTWHWNESKGVCEDYGVVGTSTRGIDSK